MENDKVWEIRWRGIHLNTENPKGVVAYASGHLGTLEVGAVLETVYSIVGGNVAESFQAATGRHQPYPAEGNGPDYVRCGHSPWLEARRIPADQAQWQQERRATTFAEAVVANEQAGRAHP